jgi:hypothetical protein
MGVVGGVVAVDSGAVGAAIGDDGAVSSHPMRPRVIAGRRPNIAGRVRNVQIVRMVISLSEACGVYVGKKCV